MANFHHGITAQELTQGLMPMRNANISVIGLIATSIDADESMYPADTPVLLTGITKDNLAQAGQQGTLRASLQAIRDIHNPTVVVMRVTDAANVDVLDELLTCQSRLGVTPKILGAPLIDTPAVVHKLVSIAKRRRAFVYASPRRDDGTLITDLAGIAAYRDQFGARELHLIENEWGQPVGAPLPFLGEVLTPVDVYSIYPPMFSAIDPDNSNDYFIAENVANPTIYEYFKVDGIDVRNKISGAYNYGFIADTDIKLVQGRDGFEGKGGYMCVFELKNGRVKTYFQGEPNHLIEIKYISEFSKYKPEVFSQDSTGSVNSDGSIRFYI